MNQRLCGPRVKKDLDYIVEGLVPVVLHMTTMHDSIFGLSEAGTCFTVEDAF